MPPTMAAGATQGARVARIGLPTSGSARALRAAGYVALAAAILAAWQVAAVLAGANLLPGPAAVLVRASQLAASGELQEHVGYSAERLFVGWLIGCVIAVPLGLTMAQVGLVRRIVEPYLHFLRFIPPIAYVSLALIWFGIGELSKVVLIVYTTSFTVTVATLTAALSVRQEVVWAAHCLGASPRQTLYRVLLPASVPGMVTGMRLGLATSFKTIVAAEMIGARSGLGYLIWSSRGLLDFESIMVGVVVLACMGLLADVLFRCALRPIAYRFQVAL
jgi:NitT/TauT family transport system permease protein